MKVFILCDSVVVYMVIIRISVERKMSMVFATPERREINFKKQRIVRKRPQTVPPQAQQFKDNYGPWMLVSRKDRRRQGWSGNIQEPGMQAAKNRPVTPLVPTVGIEGLGSKSIFRVLDGVEGDDQVHMHEMVDEGMELTCYQSNELPCIRTTNRQNFNPTKQRHSIENLRTRAYIPQVHQHRPAPRGAFRGRGGRGGAPHQAAAETEHTVVRGSNRGRQVTSTVVYQWNEQPRIPLIDDTDYTLMGEPPDLPRVFTIELTLQI